MKPEYTVRAFRASDEKFLIPLVVETFGFGEEFWRWKHLSYPNFTPSSIVVAEENGRVIGTSSWIPRDLKVSKDLVIRSALGGDTAVAPSFRGRGVGTHIMRFFYAELKKNEVIVTTGSATRDVARKFYAPFGSILMRDFTTNYIKYLNCNHWKKKIARASEEKEAVPTKLRDKKFSVKFDLHGAPPFILAIQNGGISLEECTSSSLTETNVTIRTDMGHLMPFFQGEKGAFSLLKLVVTRRIRTKGLLRNSVTLFRMFRTIAPFFRD